MGRAFLRMNECYFAGEIFDTTGFEEGIRLWEDQHESFTSLYIRVYWILCSMSRINLNWNYREEIQWKDL